MKFFTGRIAYSPNINSLGILRKEIDSKTLLGLRSSENSFTIRKTKNLHTRCSSGIIILSLGTL